MKNYRIDDKVLKSLEGQIADWKKEGKKLAVISLEKDDLDLICKIPGEFEMKKAKSVEDDLDKDKQLVMECVLYPSPEEVQLILLDRPLIATPIAVQLVNLSGATQKTTVKNL